MPEKNDPASLAGVSPLVRELFEKLDAGDVEAFIALLDESCSSSFGNIGPVKGREAVRAGIAGFFDVVAKQSHKIVHAWAAGPDHIVELEVTYTRRDGKVVILPAVTIMTVNNAGLISSYRIYIDQSPLLGS